MEKVLVLVTLAVVICATGPANAQEIFITFPDIEPAVWMVSAGVAVFGSGMCIYNAHRLHEDNPNVAAGWVGIISSGMSFYWGGELLSLESHEARFNAAGVGMLALGAVTAYYSAVDIARGHEARAHGKGLGATIGPTIVCHEGRKVIPGVQVRITF